MPAIRPLALGIIRRGEELLVFRGHDDVKGETFHRPLGGGIEFGEHADEALRREFQEELAAEVTDIALLGVVENIFTTDGRDGHEIVFLFSARFTDESLYRQEEIKILDEDNVARWVPVENFTEGRAILYPAGLVELLAVERPSVSGTRAAP
jgi:ADP-ribose pyrophosphatase YjhB (NUDIX family)